MIICSLSLVVERVQRIPYGEMIEKDRIRGIKESGLELERGSWFFQF